MELTGLTWRLLGGRLWLWAGLALLGIAIHAALWWMSEPEILFSDFYKA